MEYEEKISSYPDNLNTYGWIQYGGGFCAWT